MKIRFLSYALAVSLAGCFAATFTLQEGPREEGETALKDRDWTKAAQLLTGALAQAKTGQDEILYLLATAQQYGAQHDAATASLDRLLKEFPASPLKMKALYKKADVLAAKKEFALAAQIYDAQVAAITAPERRKRLAMIYVDAGHEFLNPKDPKDPTFVADFATAHRLLSKSLELDALGADDEGVRAEVVVCEFKGTFPPQQLLKSCESFEEKYPRSAKLDQILFARGTALRNLGRNWEAEKVWTRLAAEFAASERAPEGLFAAALLHVRESGESSDLEHLRQGLKLLRRVTAEFAASEQGLPAAYLIGLALAQVEELRDEARKELTAFAEAHAKHERAPDALFKVAQLHLADQDDTQAIATYEDFLKRYPDSALWPAVRQSIPVVRNDRRARAKSRKDWAQVRTLAQEFLDLHPTDPTAIQAALDIGTSLKEEKKFKEAVEAWMKVAARYPAFEEGHQARYLAAEVLASELEDFETAMKELPKVGGNWKSAALQLVQRLQDPSLVIASERVFEIGEAPSVKMTVRNVETVKFRYWTLDLKDYFEKKASTAGIQNLEVSVIAPDQEWEVPVKEYKRFKDMKLDVELPKKDPGAYIVTASSGRFETTTVALVSDLAMIARAGRRGAAVIVENMKTGERVANPAVSTAADGKHLKAWTPETTASRLSFMAETPGGLAFRDLDVSTLPVSQERQPLALVMTDRQVYGPQDEVRVHLLVRDAVDNAYVVPKDKKYRLSAVSEQGVTFREVDFVPSAAGIAIATFRLPRGIASLVRLDVFELAKPLQKLVGQQTVLIGAAPQRSRHFELLLDDKPFFSSDPIEASVVLRDSWDRPLPGRQVRIQLPGESTGKERLTGPDGTIAVSILEKDLFARGGGAAIHVQHENIGETFTIPVLYPGVILSFESSSRLQEPQAAGEAKSVDFTAKRADDSPLSRPFQWRVLRTDVAGLRSVVASGEVTTNAEGKGSITFTPKEGGLHQVTVLMKDADGLPTRIQGTLAVFDDKEEAKLRILSAADEFEPGRPFEVQVQSRLDKGLAFVTVESEKVEQLVAVALEKGRNTIRLAAPPASTRDFGVAVMMMQGNTFHSEARDFRLKDFDFKVEPSKKEFKPGEAASIAVTAKPGSEVVLVVADHTPEGFDAAAFLRYRPGRMFASESSAALAFQGQSRQVDEQVLQAMARLEDLRDNGRVRVMMAIPAPEEAVAGAGGGGGGRYGGLMAGKRNLVARGGGTAQSTPQGRGAPVAEPAPLFFGSAVADAAGKATFTVALPHERGNYVAVAWGIDASNAIVSKSAELKARAPVTVRVRAPESAVEGEKTGVVALITNHSGQEQEVTLSFGGDVKVKVPARSTLEKDFDWTAAPAATFAMDGIAQDLRTEMRPVSPRSCLKPAAPSRQRPSLLPRARGRSRSVSPSARPRSWKAWVKPGMRLPPRATRPRGSSRRSRAIDTRRPTPRKGRCWSTAPAVPPDWRTPRAATSPGSSCGTWPRPRPRRRISTSSPIRRCSSKDSPRRRATTPRRSCSSRSAAAERRSTASSTGSGAGPMRSRRGRWLPWPWR